MCPWIPYARIGIVNTNFVLMAANPGHQPFPWLQQTLGINQPFSWLQTFGINPAYGCKPWVSTLLTAANSRYQPCSWLQTLSINPSHGCKPLGSTLLMAANPRYQPFSWLQTLGIINSCALTIPSTIFSGATTTTTTTTAAHF